MMLLLLRCLPRLLHTLGMRLLTPVALALFKNVFFFLCANSEMQVDRSFNVASPSTSSASSSQQHAKNSIIPSLLQQTQQQRVHDRIHGSIKTDQRRQGLCSRPASELSFAELPRHGAVVRQQLQRLKDEVALLQVLCAFRSMNH